MCELDPRTNGSSVFSCFKITKRKLLLSKLNVLKFFKTFSQSHLMITGHDR